MNACENCGKPLRPKGKHARRRWCDLSCKVASTRARRSIDLVQALASSRDDEWMSDAACRSADVDRELFFAADSTATEHQGGGEENSRVQQAKRICRTRCPVASQCLSYALQYHEKGVWGGTSQNERMKMMKAGVTA